MASTSNDDACVRKWKKELETADYLPVLKEAQKGDWEGLHKRLQAQTDSLGPETEISMFSENIIHVIVCLGGRGSTALLKSIINKPGFDKAILMKRDCGGNTALYFAATVGNTEAAKIMVERAPEVLDRSDLDTDFPVYNAARFGHKETTRYLFDQMIQRENHNFADSNWGVLLVNLLITADFYDMANELIKRFPQLAYEEDKNGDNPLQIFCNRPFGGNHGDALKLIRQICEAMCLNAKRLKQTASDFLWEPLLKATRLGTYEIVAEIINTCPYMVWFTDDFNRTIIHHAVIHRHERIFNIIWDLGASKHRIADYASENGTNILHLAGLLGKTTATRVSGAALQMQRELQWFKEVEKLAQVSFQDKEITVDDEKNEVDDEKKEVDDEKNEVDDEKKEVDEYKDLRGTPRMVFTEQHKDLLKEGTEWMITTSNAYTIVTALIITVLFAAAFTVPGGTDDETNIPNFLHEASFIAFSIANSIGFFASSISLMMFLGILTSRYSEDDFLFSLPMKLVIGLFTLYISILCMLVVFSATVYIYLQDLSKMVLIAIIVCSCIPAIIFMFLQFPLLCEVASATFGLNIFRQECNLSLKSNISSAAYILRQDFVGAWAWVSAFFSKGTTTAATQTQPLLSSCTSPNSKRSRV